MIYEIRAHGLRLAMCLKGRINLLLNKMAKKLQSENDPNGNQKIISGTKRRRTEKIGATEKVHYLE